MRTALTAVVAALAFATAIASATQPQFKSGVEVVYLDVTVQAPDGSIVRGLTKNDFIVVDEDVQREVAVFSDEPAPISVGVLIDTSGSMTGERMAAAIRASEALGRSLQPADLWSISTFDSRRRTMIGWRAYDPKIINSLRAMPTSGATELFSSVADMVPYMRDTPHRKRAMLVMTDGADNAIIAWSRQRQMYGAGAGLESTVVAESSAKAQQALREGEVLLYALGIAVASRSGAVHVPSLQVLAEPTGGSVLIASNLRDVDEAAQRIANELRQQYTLGFYPDTAGGPLYRRIRVTTRHPDYRVRTRAGYQTSRTQ
jgi:Ca-activated chloride channel family protein